MNHSIYTYISYEFYPPALLMLFLFGHFILKSPEKKKELLNTYHLFTAAMAILILMVWGWDILYRGIFMFSYESLMIVLFLGFWSKFLRGNLLYMLLTAFIVFLRPTIIILSSLQQEFLPRSVSSYSDFYMKVALQSLLACLITLAFHYIRKPES